MTENRHELNKNLAGCLGGVIMDVQNLNRQNCWLQVQQQLSAIRAAGGVSRMSGPKMIR